MHARGGQTIPQWQLHCLCWPSQATWDVKDVSLPVVLEAPSMCEGRACCASRVCNPVPCGVVRMFSCFSVDRIPCNVKVLFLMGRVCLQWAKELMRQAAGAADGRVVHPCADDSKRTARTYLRSYRSSQGTKHPLGCCGSAKQALPLLCPGLADGSARTGLQSDDGWWCVVQ
jgi:hypothetical protein